MNSIKAFQKITEYCDKKAKDIPTRNHAFCAFMEGFKSEVAQQKKKNKGKIAKGLIESICNPLINDANIKNYVATAENVIEETESFSIEKILTRMNQENNSGFWTNVWASTLGTIFYTISLIFLSGLLMFWLSPETFLTKAGQIIQIIKQDNQHLEGKPPVQDIATPKQLDKNTIAPKQQNGDVSKKPRNSQLQGATNPAALKDLDSI
jgi:hypothetical protein